MTEQEVLTLEPRERDAVVAVALGWKQTKVERAGNSYEVGDVLPHLPRFTTSIAHAWELVEEMEEAGWHWCSLHYTTTQKGPTFHFWKPGTDGLAFMADTLPLAICLAYMFAKGAIQ